VILFILSYYCSVYLVLLHSFPTRRSSDLGLMTKNNSYLVENLHKESPHKEILLMKGHNIDYGAPISTMINLGGGDVKEVGYANGCDLSQIEAAITDNTAGIMFIKSHHSVQKNMP